MGDNRCVIELFQRRASRPDTRIWPRTDWTVDDLFLDIRSPSGSSFSKNATLVFGLSQNPSNRPSVIFLIRSSVGQMRERCRNASRCCAGPYSHSRNDVPSKVERISCFVGCQQPWIHRNGSVGIPRMARSFTSMRPQKGNPTTP